jgi:hypothetical protein
MTDVSAEYNLLNECKFIRNKERCAHDSNYGFEAIFSNGDNGFTDNVGLNWHMADGLFLWATSTDGSCYISLSDPLTATFEADFFSNFELDMLVRYNPGVVGKTLPDTITGKIAWRMDTDPIWWDDACVTFDVIPDGAWQHYKFSLLGSPKWVGNCQDIRLYPFIDGAPYIEVIIQRIAFTSDAHYKCKFPPCSWNSNYTHTCPATGTCAKAYSLVRRPLVQVDGNNCRIGVSLDNYPPQYIDLDLSHCTDCYSVAQDITLKLNTLSFGGYKFAECAYNSVDENFTIYTGTKGTSGSVQIYHGGDKDVTEQLGFFRSSAVSAYKTENGTEPADGYSPAYQRLSATMLYRLPSSESTVITFDPKQPTIEIGRSDLMNLPSEQLIEEGSISGILFVDIFGAANDEGNIKTIQFKGKITNHSKVYLLRPTGDFTLAVVYSRSMTILDLRRGQKTLYEFSVDWHLKPGDMLGLYMCQPAMHTESSSAPNLQMLYKNSWIEIRNYNLAVGDSVSYTPESVKFYGYQGLPVYGFSTDKCPGFGIEAELRGEYGVQQLAVVGEDSIDNFEFDLMKLGTSQVMVSTDKTVGPMQDVGDSDLMIEFQDTDDISKFWIDFWFPGYIHNIYRIITTFEESNNIREFCWEAYIEPVNRSGLNWSGVYHFSTDAPYLGSAVGWMRLLDPLVVYIDDDTDMTGDLYLGFNYVTGNPYDLYPGVSDQTRYDRMTASYKVLWNKLDQTFYPFDSRGLRLYVSNWADPKITSIKVFSIFSTRETILRSLYAVGSSGPEIFDTESYNIVDLTGQLLSSRRISRAKTTDYSYGMNFEYQNEDYTTGVATIGTTLSKLSLDIRLFPTKIKQIKLIPQHLGVEVRMEGNEPITDICNMSWGAPSDGSEFTYGPTVEYEVHNDTGHRANLLLGVADPLAIDQTCIFASKLDSQESIDDPYRGCTAQIISSPDTPVTNHRCINYHARVYSIMDVTPVAWYSSTNSGVVWQTLVSGSPFTTPVHWNEPADPNNSIWSVSNWCRAEELQVSSGILSINQKTRPYQSNVGWVNPTYFQDTTKESTMSLETQVVPFSGVAGADISAGLVMYDNQDLQKYLCIERYSGNSLSTVSGHIFYDDYRFDLPLSDYIRYGDSSVYYTPSGNLPDIIPTNASEYGMILRLIKDGRGVTFSYRLPWNSWTTVSSYSIQDWSNDIRVGVFGAAPAIASISSDAMTNVTFDYVSYKTLSNRVVEDFNYETYFEDLVITHGDWTAVNPHEAFTLSSSDTGLTIKNWMGFDNFNFFDYRLLSPALQTEWGSITDYGTIISRVSGFDPQTIASGTFSAGLLLCDSSNNNNHIKFCVKTSSQLELIVSGSVLPVTISPIDTASGVWLQLHKSSSIAIPSYSYDGGDYTIVSGIYIGGWSSIVPTELALSSDMGEVTFDNIQVTTLQIDSTNLAAKFDPPLPLLNIYGQKDPWSDLQYTTSSDLTDFSTTKPAAISYLKFSKSPDADIDLGSPKFMPDLQVAKSIGYEVSSTEVFKSNQQIYDYIGDLQVTDPIISSSGTGMVQSDSLSYKGLAQYDAPVIAFDMGKPYSLGRCQLVTQNAKGRFSNSDQDYLTSVNWESSSFEEGGFKRRCLYSSNLNECVANAEWAKPIMVYNNEDDPEYYFAGTCDGWETDAGAVNKACPIFTGGEARWILLESTNYTSTTISAGSIWFVGPVEAGPHDRPIPLTSNFYWWTTDYGLMQWVDNTEFDPEYALVYSYPGFNTPGSCYFNGQGSPYWKLTPDPYWTWEDSFQLDLKFINSANINSVEMKIGRDPTNYYLFTVTGTLLNNEWKSYKWRYKDVPMISEGTKAITEPAFTLNDLEHYSMSLNTGMPLPFLNFGYAELSVSGTRGSNIYIKNMKNTRTRFEDGHLFLGLEESLYLPLIDLMNTGTIQFTYHPSEAALNLKDGDPRSFLYTIATVSNATTGICVALDLHWGWTVYCFSPKEKIVLTCLPTIRESEQIIPTPSNPGPFNITLSWAPQNIPGLTDAVVLWVNGIKTCWGKFDSMGDYMTTDDVRVILGKGTTVLTQNDIHPYAAYAGFSDLSVYKRAISSPLIDLDSTALIPENLLDLSSDGVNWKSFLNGDLPLLYPGVESGGAVTFYMRNRRPQTAIKKLHKRNTAYLMVRWEVTQ